MVSRRPLFTGLRRREIHPARSDSRGSISRRAVEGRSSSITLTLTLAAVAVSAKKQPSRVVRRRNSRTSYERI